jgi:ABC-type phosphate/phosphonate transport system substrate-binding protein
MFMPNGVSAGQTLVLGLLPAESPVGLLKRFAPLRDYLSDQVHETIILETARDISEFARRTATRHYDIVFTAPHMVMPALDSGRYELMATSVVPLKSVIVVAEASIFDTLQDLAGKRIATPPQEALVTRVGIDFLTQQGIIEKKATQLIDYRSHNAAYSAALAGEVDAAMIANFIYRKARKQRLPLRQVAESKALPGMGILLASDLHEPVKANLKKALIDMVNLPRGRALLKVIAQPGYREAEVSEFEELRRFAATAATAKEKINKSTR